MNKNKFLEVLNKNLDYMTNEERNDILYDYEEHFRIGLKEGKTEEEIVKSLGEPSDLAKQFKTDYYVKKAESNGSITNIIRAVIATIGLGFFNLIFVVGPFFGIVGVIIGLFAASIAIIAVGVTSLFASMFSTVINPFIVINVPITIFLSIGVICFGVLFFIGIFYLTKYFLKGTLKYLKFNFKIISNK